MVIAIIWTFDLVLLAALEYLPHVAGEPEKFFGCPSCPGVVWVLLQPKVEDCLACVPHRLRVQAAKRFKCTFTAWKQWESRPFQHHVAKLPGFNEHRVFTCMESIMEGLQVCLRNHDHALEGLVSCEQLYSPFNPRQFLQNHTQISSKLKGHWIRDLVTFEVKKKRIQLENKKLPWLWMCISTNVNALLQRQCECNQSWESIMITESQSVVSALMWMHSVFQ